MPFLRALAERYPAALGPGKDTGKGLLVQAYLLPHRIAEHRVEVAAGSDSEASRPAFYAHRRERRGLGNRQVAQPHGVEELEDGGVGADAKREGEHSGDGEPPTLAQGAHRKADIPQQIPGAPLIALPVCSPVRARVGALTTCVRVLVGRVTNLLSHPSACPSYAEGCSNVVSHTT